MKRYLAEIIGTSVGISFGADFRSYPYGAFLADFEKERTLRLIH